MTMLFRPGGAQLLIPGVEVLQARASAAPVFSPLDVANCIMWVDASDMVTLFQDSAGATPVSVTSDPVGRWSDKSGVGNHVTQATSGARPTYTTGVQNGLPGLSFDGGDFLDSASTYPSFPVTIVAAIKTAGTGGATRGIISLFHGSSGGSRLNYLGSDTITARIETPTSARVSAATFGTNAPIVAGARFDTAASAVMTNGAIVSGAHSASAVTNTIGIGRLTVNSPSAAWLGYICEVCIYNAALTDTDIGRLATYLNTKWNVY